MIINQDNWVEMEQIIVSEVGRIQRHDVGKGFGQTVKIHKHKINGSCVVERDGRREFYRSEFIIMYEER